MGALVSKASAVPIVKDMTILEDLRGQIDSMGSMCFLTLHTGISGYELNTLQHQRATQQDQTLGRVHMKAQRKGSVGDEEEAKQDRHNGADVLMEKEGKGKDIFLSTVEHCEYAMESLSRKQSHQVFQDYLAGKEEAQHHVHCCNSCVSNWQSQNSSSSDSSVREIANPGTSGGCVEQHTKKNKCGCVSCTMYSDAWLHARLCMMSEYISMCSHLDYLAATGRRIQDTKEALHLLSKSLKKYAQTKDELTFMTDKLVTWETILAHSVIKFHKQSALMVLWVSKFKNELSLLVSYLLLKLQKEEQTVVRLHQDKKSESTSCDCIVAWNTLISSKKSLSTLYGNMKCSTDASTLVSSMKIQQEVEKYHNAENQQEASGKIDWVRVYSKRFQELGPEKFASSVKKYQYKQQYPCLHNVQKGNTVSGDVVFPVSAANTTESITLMSESTAYSDLECTLPHNCSITPAVCRSRDNHRGVQLAAVSESQTNSLLSCTRWIQHLDALETLHSSNSLSDQRIAASNEIDHIAACVGNTMSLYPGITLLGEAEVATLQTSFLLLDKWAEDKIPVMQLPFKKTDVNLATLHAICKKKYLRNGLKWSQMQKSLSLWASEQHDLQLHRDELVDGCLTALKREHDEKVRMASNVAVDSEIEEAEMNELDDINNVNKVLSDHSSPDSSITDDDEEEESDDESDYEDSIRDPLQFQRNTGLLDVCHKLTERVSFLPSQLYGTYAFLDRVIAAHKTPHANFHWLDSLHALHRMYNCIGSTKYEKGTLIDQLCTTKPQKLRSKAKEIRYDFFKAWTSRHAPDLSKQLGKKEDVSATKKCPALTRFERIAEDFQRRQHRRDEAQGLCATHSPHSHVLRGTEGYVNE